MLAPILAIALTSFLPGWLLTQLWFNDQQPLRASEKFLLSYVLGVMAVQLLGYVLVVSSLFVGYAIAFSLGLLNLILLSIWMLRNKRQTRKVESSTNSEPWLSVTNLILVSLVVASSCVLLWTDLPLLTSAYGYIDYVMELVQNQGFPDLLYDWGLRKEGYDNKPLFSIFTAIFSELSSLEIVEDIRVIMILLWAVTVAGVFVFLRAYFPAPIATIGVMILITPLILGGPGGGTLFGVKLSSFRGENFTYPFLFAAIWAGQRGILQEQMKFLMLAMVITTFAAFTHGVVGAITSLVLASMLITKWVIGRGSIRYDIRVVVAGAILVALPVGVIAIWSLSKTDEVDEIFELVKDDPYVQQVMEDDIDPTWELGRLSKGSKDQGVRKKETFSAEKLWRRVVVRTISRLKLRNPFTFTVIAVSAGLVLLWGRRQDREVCLIFTCMATLIVVWACLFIIIFDQYMPGEQVIRREIRYVQLLFVVLIAAGLQTVSLRFSWAERGFSRRFLLAVGLVGVLGIALQSYKMHRVYSRFAVSPEVATAYRWLKDNGREDDVVLMNERTAGAMRVLSNTRGLLEGGAQYDRWVWWAISLLNGAIEFYENPLAASSIEYVDRHGVSIVVYSSLPLGGNRILGKDFDPIVLKKAPYLDLAAVIGEAMPIYIFRVNRKALVAQ